MADLTEQERQNLQDFIDWMRSVYNPLHRASIAREIGFLNEGNWESIENSRFYQYWSTYIQPQKIPTTRMPALGYEEYKRGIKEYLNYLESEGLDPRVRKDTEERAIASANVEGVHSGLPFYRELAQYRMTPDWLQAEQEKYQAGQQKYQTWQMQEALRIHEEFLYGRKQAAAALGYQPPSEYDLMSTENRIKLVQDVQAGLIRPEEAFGANSTWQRWYNTQFPQGQVAGTRAGVTPGYEGAEGSEGAALTRWGQAEIQGQKTRETKMEEARRLMGEMPEWAASVRYGQYQPQIYRGTSYQGVDPAGAGQSYPTTDFQGAASGGYQSPADVETGRFIQLMQTPEFETAYNTYRKKMLEDYGQLFTTWEQNIKPASTDVYKPFPEWLTTDPNAKLSYEKMRFTKEAPVGRPVPTWR